MQNEYHILNAANLAKDNHNKSVNQCLIFDLYDLDFVLFSGFAGKNIRA